jgi:hypothetical protein
MQLGAPIISGKVSYPSAMTPFPEHRSPAKCGTDNEEERSGSVRLEFGRK